MIIPTTAEKVKSGMHCMIRLRSNREDSLLVKDSSKAFGKGPVHFDNYLYIAHDQQFCKQDPESVLYFRADEVIQNPNNITLWVHT
jgi:hypothetical protein